MTQRSIRPVMIAVCAATLLCTGFCEPVTAKQPVMAGNGQQVTSRVPVDLLAQLNESLQKLAGKVSPSVVQIEVTSFGPEEESDRRRTTLIVRQQAIGAGVIVDPEGYIMTNAHIVERAQRVRVILSGGAPTLDGLPRADKLQVLEAKILGIQKELDLALLKIEAHNLPVLRLNVERVPQAGELVFAIGSPEGLQSSVTMGVVSSAWRQPDPDNPMGYLQTDAPINAGNSGGPLVDVSGTVLGLNTFILTSSGGSEGLGFAIPAPVVDFVYHNLRKYGHVEHIEIGVVAQTVTPTMAEGLGLPQNWGVVVVDVIPERPAATAGIMPDDIILAVDGHPVLSLTGFAAALYRHMTFEVLKVDVLRGKQKLSFEVPAIPASDRIEQFAGIADPLKSHIRQLGILGLDITDDLLPLLPGVRIESGVIVIGRAPEFGSVATTLREGDVIHSLNRTPIQSIEQLKSALAKLKPGDAAVLLMERQRQLQYLAFEME